MHIPSDIEKRLSKGEIVDNRFDLGDRTTVFTSPGRMFIKKGDTVRDIGFAHISSIESRTRSRWLVYAIGLAIIAGTFFAREIDPPDWAFTTPEGRLMWGHDALGGLFYYIIGLVLTVVGFMWKTRSVSISVSGLSQKQVFRGDRDMLDALVRVVGERRLQMRPVQTQRTNN